MTNQKKEKEQKLKTCFLITPIGTEGSTTRERVEQWMELIYSPVLNKSYRLIRADQISAPGIITEQIIQYIVDADLVIIDYTELNSNVMYEAAIRHLVAKPYIQIHESGIRLPFDIHNIRSISYNPKKLDYPDQLVSELKKCLEEINTPNYKQPQLIKEKFDFNKILNDPKKFVDLLKEIIVPLTDNKMQKNSLDSIVRISDPYYGTSSTRFNLGQTKIVCPKCKTIKYENNLGLNIPSLYGISQYRCNVCGTEFEI